MDHHTAWLKRQVEMTRARLDERYQQHELTGDAPDDAPDSMVKINAAENVYIEFLNAYNTAKIAAALERIAVAEDAITARMFEPPMGLKRDPGGQVPREGSDSTINCPPAAPVKEASDE